MMCASRREVDNGEPQFGREEGGSNQKAQGSRQESGENSEGEGGREESGKNSETEGCRQESSTDQKTETGRAEGVGYSEAEKRTECIRANDSVAANNRDAE